MIPTAETFVINRTDRISGIAPTPEQVYHWMIEFAKMHVEAALESASKNAIYDYELPDVIDEQSILKSYPLTNIK